MRIVDKQLHFVKTSLIFSKLRVALLGSKKHPNVEQGQVSLPRMKLLAGIRAIEFVTREWKLPIAKRIVFSDSECVLHWIKSTKRLPVLFRTELRNSKGTGPCICVWSILTKFCRFCNKKFDCC